MKVTEQMIDNLANLSKLSFTDDEKNEIGNDLEKMIDFVNKLNEINTEGVEPLLHMTDKVNVMRDDDVKYFSTSEELLSQAPHNDGVYVKVPKVIQKQEE